MPLLLLAAPVKVSTPTISTPTPTATTTVSRPSKKKGHRGR